MKRSEWFEGFLYMEDCLRGCADKESLALELSLACIGIPCGEIEFIKGCLDYIKHNQRLQQC